MFRIRELLRRYLKQTLRKHGEISGKCLAGGQSTSAKGESRRLARVKARQARDHAHPLGLQLLLGDEASGKFALRE